MSGQSVAKSKPRSKPKSRPIARVVCDAGRRKIVRNMETRFAGRFEVGEPIRSIAVIKNDGMYPHRDVGEALVHPGDAGTVRESWRFLGDIYYTVEFNARSVFVIMRGYEMTRMGTAFDARS
jgi:nitrogen fixation protein NifZ